MRGLRPLSVLQILRGRIVETLPTLTLPLAPSFVICLILCPNVCLCVDLISLRILSVPIWMIL
jgi:hypothetical protein